MGLVLGTKGTNNLAVGTQGSVVEQSGSGYTAPTYSAGLYGTIQSATTNTLHNYGPVVRAVIVGDNKDSGADLINLLANAVSKFKITAAGAVTVGNYWLSPIEVDDGNSGTADTIDWSTGSAHKSTLTGNVTYTLSNPVTGGEYILRIIQGASAYTAAWPATVKWPGGVAPTITVTNGAIDIVRLYWDGTSYYGTFTQAYA
jgi:hypothetical protein